MLDDGAAVSLLAETIGVQLHPSEREAADEIIRHCGYLPLAIKVAGARLRARRHHSGALGSLADRLREERHRLDLLHAEDIGVRTSLAISYETLTTNTARAFRLLGLFPGPKLQRYAAAAMLKTSVEDAERSLEALAELSLLDAAERDYYRWRAISFLVRVRYEDQPPPEQPPSSSAGRSNGGKGRAPGGSRGRS
jgi:hypothetical protein